MLKYYRSYILYRRSMNTMVIGMLLTIAILAFLFSSVYSSALVEQIGIEQRHTAAVLMHNIDNLRAELLRLAAYMCNDNAYINSMMFKTDHDRLRDFFGGLFIKQLLLSNSDVSFIAVYNQSLGELRSTTTLTEACSREIKARAIERYEGGEMSGFEPLMLRLRVIKGMRAEVPSVALFFYSPLSNPDSVGALVIGISCDALNVSVEGTAPDAQQTAMIVDEAGRVLSHPDPAMLLKEVSGEPYMLRISEMEEASGSFRGIINDESTLITYETGAFGWTYLSLISYDAILSKLLFLRNITIAASLCMIAFTGLYAVLGARHTFRPIEHLIDPTLPPGAGKPYKTGRDADISFLSDRIRAYQKQRGMETSIQNYALKQWISGESTAEQARTAMYAAGILEGEPAVLIWACVDRTEAFTALSLNAQSELMGALYNHICAAFEGTTARCLNIPWSQHEQAILLLSPGRDAADVAAALHEALHNFEQKFSLPCCASMVPCTAATTALPASLREAREFYKQHFALADPSRKVIDSSGASFSFVSYDPGQERDVLEALRNGDDDALRKAVLAVTKRLRVCTPEDARNYALRLMKNVLDARHLPQETAARRLEAIPAVLSMDTLSLLEEGMIRFFRGIQSDAQKADAPGQNNIIVEAAIRMTQDRFEDKDFNLYAAAQTLSLAPTYFNRLFRKYAGMSFSAYLTTYRLHQACVLLRTTRDPLSQVFLSTGFTNENYCYTLFKKEFGLTPSQYRERYGEG